MADNHGSTGVSAGTVVLIVFIVLKLTDLVTWSWLWVLSPMWIGLSLALAIVAIVGVVWLISEIIETVKRNRRLSRQYNEQRKGK